MLCPLCLWGSQVGTSTAGGGLLDLFAAAGETTLQTTNNKQQLRMVVLGGGKQYKQDKTKPRKPRQAVPQELAWGYELKQLREELTPPACVRCSCGRIVRHPKVLLQISKAFPTQEATQRRKLQAAQRSSDNNDDNNNNNKRGWFQRKKKGWGRTRIWYLLYI